MYKLDTEYVMRRINEYDLTVIDVYNNIDLMFFNAYDNPDNAFEGSYYNYIKEVSNVYKKTNEISDIRNFIDKTFIDDRYVIDLLFDFENVDGEKHNCFDDVNYSDDFVKGLSKKDFKNLTTVHRLYIRERTILLILKDDII